MKSTSGVEFKTTLKQLRTAEDPEEGTLLCMQLVILLEDLPETYQGLLAEVLMDNTLTIETVEELILTIYDYELHVIHESLITAFEAYLDHATDSLVIVSSCCLAQCCPNGISRILSILSSPTTRPRNAALIMALLWHLVF